MPLKLDTLESTAAWIYKADAEMASFTDNQVALNLKTDTRLGTIEDRQRSLEARVVWITGFSAGVGAMVGVVIAMFFKLAQ